MRDINPHAQFPTTHWSLVRRAGLSGADSRQWAMTELLRRYWPALHAYLVRRRRLGLDQAEDVVQSFIADKVIVHGLISKAEEAKGKFRTLLLTALDRYATNVLEAERAKKRSADRAAGLPEDFEVADTGTVQPADAFDAQWARQVIAEATNRMRAECVSNGRDDVWGIFDLRVLGPLIRNEDPPAYDKIVVQYKIASPSQASNLLITAKRAFARSLRAVVGEYARDEGEIESEISELQRVLAREKRK